MCCTFWQGRAVPFSLLLKADKGIPVLIQGSIDGPPLLAVALPVSKSVSPENNWSFDCLTQSTALADAGAGDASDMFECRSWTEHSSLAITVETPMKDFLPGGLFLLARSLY